MLRKTRYILVAALALGLAACRHEQPRETTQDDTAMPSKTSANKLFGSYTGPFGDNKIMVTISGIKDHTVQGRSIVAGNDRPFEGTITETEKGITVTAKEPGDDAHDGTFVFQMENDHTDKLTGTWTAFDTKLGSKDFSLDRRKFAYNKSLGRYPEASQRLLTNTDLEDLYKEDLTYMRNEIFARHGYCFRMKSIREQFDTQDWYVPFSTDVKGTLTDIEKKNIALIKQYEKHSEEYGDDYGR
jgi:hypothetical protein